jgi:hypothetical protein
MGKDKKPTRSDATIGALLDVLAKRLHAEMENLDPTEDGKWEHLSEREKEFYRLTVSGLFEDRASIRALLDRL